MNELAAIPVPEAVPARMVNEVLYCPRLMYLEWVQGEFRDNEFTIEGRAVHKNADREGGRLPAPAPVRNKKGPSEADARDTPDSQDGAGAADGDPEPVVARSVWLTSETLGLTARIDVLEGTAGGVVIPIEYKRGGVPRVPERAYISERAQLCAQVLLLREHGYQCDEALIYFAADRRRVAITIDDELIDTTRRAIADARRIAGQPAPPPPLENSPKCRGCSLAPICLPDEVVYLRHIERLSAPVLESEPVEELVSQREPEAATDQLEPAVTTELRRLHPARDDSLPVYVQEHGAHVGVTGDRLRVVRRSGETIEAQLPHTSQVSIFGYAQVTTQALHALFRHGIPLSFFTSGGWYIGQSSGMNSKNIELRIAQYRAADDPTRCLRLASSLVAAKISNSRTFLRRNSDVADQQALRMMAQQAKNAGQASGLDELLGIEGSAARAYFQAFTAMLKGDNAQTVAESFERRNRRPPRDPVNALLSFAYSLLTKDVTLALAAVGLDPMRGFYHQLRFGRPALALDLMEEFRPLIADSVVVTALNTGVVTAADFQHTPVSVLLGSAGRKRFLRAYERRMDHLVSHPVFGYRISYRRVLEVQARLLSRFLLGEITAYPNFRTR